MKVRATYGGCSDSLEVPNTLPFSNNFIESDSCGAGSNSQVLLLQTYRTLEVC